MAIKFENTQECEKPRSWENGEYLFTIVRSEEKKYQSGNVGYELDFSHDDKLNIKYQKFFAFKKAANHFLNLLNALGYCEGMTVKEMESCNEIPEAEDLTGLKVYADCKKNEDGYLEPKFCGFRKYENTTKPAKKAEPVEDPF